MSYDPFADVFGSEILRDDGSDGDLTGVARSLDAAHAQDIIVVDEVEESPTPDTDVGASEAALKIQKAAPKKNARKRQRSPAEVAERPARKYDAEKHLLLTPVPAMQGADIKSVSCHVVKTQR